VWGFHTTRTLPLSLVHAERARKVGITIIQVPLCDLCAAVPLCEASLQALYQLLPFMYLWGEPRNHVRGRGRVESQATVFAAPGAPL
jgi:hypothetical protein